MSDLLILDRDETLVSHENFLTQPYEGAEDFVRDQAERRECIVVTRGRGGIGLGLTGLAHCIERLYTHEDLETGDGGGFFIDEKNRIRAIGDYYEWKDGKLVHKRTGKEFDIESMYFNSHFLYDSHAEKFTRIDGDDFIKDLELVKRKYRSDQWKGLNSAMIGNHADIPYMASDPKTPLVVVEHDGLWARRNHTRVLLEALYQGASTTLVFDELYGTGMATELADEMMTDSRVATIDGVRLRLSRNNAVGIRIAEENFTEGVEIESYENWRHKMKMKQRTGK